MPLVTAAAFCDAVCTLDDGACGALSAAMLQFCIFKEE
eukprot:gene53676-33607_t